MKKTFLILLFSIGLIKYNIAQTYRQLFDNLNTSSWGRAGYHSLYSNFNSKLSANANMMQSYIKMYNATKDVKYLHEFLIHAKRTMERSDANISSANPVIDFPNGYHPVNACAVNQVALSFLNTGYPAWSRFEWTNQNNLCQLVPYPHFMETGGIVYPLAQFVLLLMEESSLASNSLPTEAAFNNVNTFGDFAAWLKPIIYSILDWQISQDYKPFGDCDYCPAFVSPFNDGGKAYNQQCAMGLSLILMYHIAVIDNDVTHINNYSPKISNIAGRLKDEVQNNPPPNLGNPINLPWYAWCHAPECSGDLWEDISHAVIDVEFAELCYKYFPNHFGLSEMQKFANGFAYKMIPWPLRFTMNVYGTDDNCDQMCITTENNLPANKFRYHISGLYPFLSQYNKQIYQEISDFYSPDNVNFFANQDNALTLKAYSSLSLYKHLFNPIATNGGSNRSGNPSSPYTTFINATAGDFNNDGSEEFAVINPNSGGIISIYYLNSSNIINLLSHYSPVAFTDITSGNFDINNAGDEIAAINSTNNICLLKYINGNLAYLSANITPPETIVSVSSGDFNNDGKDEIVALSNNHIYIYQHSVNNLTLLYSFVANNFSKVSVGKFEGGNTNQIALLKSSGDIRIFNSNGINIYSAQAPTGNYISMASGDYDGDGISEIVVYQNTDATFRVFKIRDGVLSYNNGDEEVFPTNQGHGVMCSSRFSNYSDKDALVTFRNFDNQINIFTLDGFCPNLYLNNQTINDAYFLNNTSASINNNYPIDYHVSNVLAASNYVIESGKTVDFMAGNKIILKSGFNAKSGSEFHAFISPALSCANENNQYFRNNATNNQLAKLNATKAKLIENKFVQNETDINMLIGIFPNPGNGYYTLRTEYEGNYTVSVFDIIGSNLKEFNFSGKENHINITELNPGLYTFSIKREGGNTKNVKIIKQ